MQWASQGVWSPQADGTDILTCDARNEKSTGKSSGGVLATGDSYGRLKLWRYPVDSSLVTSCVRGFLEIDRIFFFV